MLGLYILFRQAKFLNRFFEKLKYIVTQCLVTGNLFRRIFTESINLWQKVYKMLTQSRQEWEP